MKRFVALVIAVLFVLFLAGTIYAAPGDISVTVTMATYSLSVSCDAWAIGEVTPSQVKVKTDTCYVKNGGGVNMDVTLISDSAAVWKLKTTGDATGKDSVLLRAVFAFADTSGIDSDSFQTDDAITYAAQEGTNAKFYSPECGSGADGSGLDIAAGDSVSLWLWFKAPTTSTTVGSQEFTITVGGKVAD